ncbi:hypothetical protein ALNOE001_08250 [Candidatus Methanobinarius endosymbioticus]|uniref:Bacterial Ig-like domain (Group 1) n=1 Tax=Candidatus Methanobinarius endosymbioticus TaxID=2006182 RepID=A0A366MBJ1_9EURY|nr:hypothetical protein ALNOE001_08250 [Candidatus Methanobinarius endosymbioticus]
MISPGSDTWKGQYYVFTVDNYNITIPPPWVTNLTTNDVSEKYNSTIELVAKLKNQTGNSLAGYKVTFYLTDQKGNIRKTIGSAVTDNKGEARLRYKIVEGGNYNMLAKFNYLGNYTASMGIGNARFAKFNPSITINNVSTKSGQAVILKSKLVNEENGKPLAGETVKFYLNGKYVGKAVTDSNGIAKLKYIPNVKSDSMLSIIAKYDGGGAFNSSSNEGFLEVTTVPRLNPNPSNDYKQN